MHKLHGLLLLGTLCCSCSLWDPFIQDTDANCKTAGCPTGQRCNADSGLCEVIPVPTTTDCSRLATGCFSAARSILNDSKYASYSIAATDLVGDANLDLAIAGDATSLCLLSGDGKFATSLTSLCSAAVPSGDISLFPTGVPVIFLHAFISPVTRTRDLLAGIVTDRMLQLNKDAVKAGTAQQTYLTLPSFKLISGGDLNGDSIEDVVITSSLLPLATKFFSASGVGGSTGNMQIWLGAMDGTFVLQQLTRSFNNLSFAAAAPGGPRSPFNMALIPPSSPTTEIANFAVDSTGVASLSTVEAVALGNPFDLAIPVDADQDGDYDLILARIVDGSTPPVGSLMISYNTSVDKDKPVFSTPMPIAAGPDDNFTSLFALKIDDFDQDGYPDIAVALFDVLNPTMKIYRSQQGKAFAQAFNLPGAFFPRDMTLVDMDGDGCKDLVALYNGRFDISAPNGFSTAGSEVKIARGHYNLHANPSGPACN